MKSFRQFRAFSTLFVESADKNPSSAIPRYLHRENWNQIPIPHRSIPEPRGQDLDYVNVAHSHLLHSDWAKLDKLMPNLTPFRVKHILLKSQSNYSLSLEFFKRVELQIPKSNTLETSCLILHILTKHRKFKSAEAILRKMLNSCSIDFPSKIFDAILHSYRMCGSSPRVFDSLFKTLAHMKRLRNATDIFQFMKGYGFLPTVESCNSLMSSMISSNRVGLVLMFYRKMQHSRISPNVYTLNMVIGALCKLGELEKAVELFAEMENMGLSPTVASYNTLIAGHCEKDLLSSGMMLKSKMVNKEVRPDVVTYNTLIHGLCKEGKLHEAYKLFNEMRSADVAPSIVTFNTLINGYSQGGNSEMAGQIFEQMSQNGIKADILTYNAMISGLCKQGKTKKAAYLVKELDKRKLVPNSSTFAALISGQCARNNPKRAFELYKSMIRSGCQPNEHTLKMLMSSFCKNEDFEGAVEILKEMLKRSVAPDSSVITELYSGLNRCGKCKLTASLSKEIDDTKLLLEGFEEAKSISFPLNIQGKEKFMVGHCRRALDPSTLLTNSMKKKRNASKKGKKES